MLWQKGRRSDNVVSSSGGARRMGGAGGMGLGGIVIVFLISWALGKNPLEVLSLLMQDGSGPAPQSQTESAPPSTQTNDFVRAILEQRACADFIVWKLYRYFVADIPSDFRDIPGSALPVLRALSSTFLASRYEVKPVLRRLFLSRHFYDPSPALDTRPEWL